MMRLIIGRIYRCHHHWFRRVDGFRWRDGVGEVFYTAARDLENISNPERSSVGFGSCEWFVRGVLEKVPPHFYLPSKSP